MMRKIVPLGVALICCASFLILVLAFCGSGYDTYVDNKIKPLAIQGKIVGKFTEETGCFGAIIFEQHDQLDTLRKIFYCTPQENKVWSYIMPNDSIYKSKGTLVVYIVRNGIKKEFTFPTSI